MQKLTMVVVAVCVAGMAAHQVPVRAQAAQGLSVHATGASPDSVLDLAMNGGKVGEIKTDGTGTGVSTLDVTPLGDVQVQVFVERCEDGKVVRVQMVVVGETVPENEGCDRRPIGFFWANKTRSVTIDVASGTLQTSTTGLSRQVKIGIGAAVLGGTAIAIGTSGSDSSSTGGGAGSGSGSGSGSGGGGNEGPAGNYPSTAVVALDPANHRAFIALAPNLILVVSLSGSNMTVAGPTGSNWVTVSGTFNTSSSSGLLIGSGVVAGISNVSVRLTLNISSSGALSGTLVMGANGELPGGQSISYTIAGQRQ